MSGMRPDRRQFLLTGSVGLGALWFRSPATAREPAAPGQQGDAPWPRLCRPHLEWMNWDPDPDFDKYVTQLIERARAIRSDTLVYCFESGGYLLYPGKTAPPYRHLGGYDLLGAIERAAHAADLKFCVCFLGMSGNTYVSQQHPEWIQTNAAGERMGKWHGYNFRSLCPNSPYRTYLADCARELLDRYAVDGLYLEGIYMPQGYCYCDACRRAYQQQYGRDMPVDGLSENRQYHEFRQRSCAGVWQALRTAIQETSPETLLFGGINAAYWFADANFNLQQCSHLADVVCIEGQWNYDLPKGFDPAFAPELRELGLILQIMRAEARKPVLSTVWIAKHVDQNYSPRSAANVTLNFAELLFQGATVQVHTQNALEVDDTHRSTLARLNDTVARLQPWLADSRVVSQVGLVRSADPRDPSRTFDYHLRGYYKALLENHIPTRVVTERELHEGLAADCPVWIFCSASDIEAATVASVERHVAAGGGAIFTYRCFDGQPRLAEMVGIRSLGELRAYSTDRFPLHTYYRIPAQRREWGDLAGKLLSFQGSRVQAVPADGTDVVARVVDLDPARMSEQDILRAAWPGEVGDPLILMARHGQGRVCTILADLDAAARRYGDPHSFQVLVRAVLNVAPDPPPVLSDAPPTVEIVTHASDYGLAILMLNQTTNQTSADPIRYVVPLRDVSVTVADRLLPSANCTTLTGQSPVLARRDDQVTVTVRDLAEYEGILFR